MKKYSTPHGSVAVVAVMLIDVELILAGTADHVIGSGVGGVPSGVVAEAVAEKAVSFCAAERSLAFTWYVYWVSSVSPVSV